MLARMLWRLALYFRPHFFAVLGGVAFAFTVRWLSMMSGECPIFCRPPITFSLGLLGGLIGAQLYRSENPLPPLKPAD